MSNSIEAYNAEDYEQRYSSGYGLLYPESHIIRVYKQIIDWELKITSGKAFDFGCGVGANIKYFADQGFEPFGCDTSETAVSACKKVMPKYSGNFHVSDVHPELQNYAGEGELDVFISNQVLYFFDDEKIRDIVQQAYSLVRPGGVFVATMMAYSCWYVRHIAGREGDFQRVDMDTPRQQHSTLINFKQASELESLFSPFRKLHLGSYSNSIREDEGPTDHWIFVGVRD